MSKDAEVSLLGGLLGAIGAFALGVFAGVPVIACLALVAIGPRLSLFLWRQYNR